MQTRNDPLNEADQSTSLQLASIPDAVRKSKRTHSWHASYAVLAVMTSVLVLSGCDNKKTAEQAGTEADKAVQTVPENAPAPSAGYPADPPMTTPGATDPAMNPPAQAPGSTMDTPAENPGDSPTAPAAPMQ
ncbi:MAG: hypothetical protein IV085_04465 [Thiobacillus sp.]|nr:hypothetical protein [Thiobacillus sp.]